MTASCVCVVYRRRRADADTHRPRRKVRDAVRRSPTQSYLVKAFLQPATERNPQPCPPHRHACAPDAVAQHRKANRANAAQHSKEAPTRRVPEDGASCERPNCGTTRSASTTVVVDPPSRSITSSHSAKAANVGTGPTLRACAASITSPRASSTRSAAEQDHDDRSEGSGPGIAKPAGQGQRRGGDLDARSPRRAKVGRMFCEDE